MPFKHSDDNIDPSRTRAGRDAGGDDRLAPIDPAHFAAQRAAHARAAGTPAGGTSAGGPSANGSGATAPNGAVDLGATRGAPAMRATAQRAARPHEGAARAAAFPEADATGPYDFSRNRQPEPEPRRPSHRALKIGLGVAAGVIVVAYAAGAIAFSRVYYPGTTIAGIDVSLSDAAGAAKRIEATVTDYSLDVSGLGFEWTYTPEAGTFSVDAQAEAQSVLDANESFIWPVRLVQSLTSGDEAETETGVVVTYDEAGFEQSLGAAIDKFNANRPGTFDAAGAYDGATGQFTVAKARSSQRLSRDAVIAAAKDAIAHAEPAAALDDSMYEQFAGGATDEQLQAACDAANQIIGVNITLKYGDAAIATLDGATMTQWITFDENLNPTLNADSLTEWIRNLAATQLDTVGTERTYTRADGKQITVSGGTYGWLSDEAALAQTIQDAIANKQTGDIQIPTKQTADVYNGLGGRDWGAYVDIDLTEQHVRYYDANDNLLWESGCITGNPNSGHETPTGVYMLNSNGGGATLVGADENGDGEPDYRTPVSYWMPFIGGAIGLHDADWQRLSNFSDPSAYKRVGSHGCVNLPVDKAAELSGMLQVGVCVITHY